MTVACCTVVEVTRAGVYTTVAPEPEIVPPVTSQL
jgi:hypothetical protein